MSQQHLGRSNVPSPTGLSRRDAVRRVAAGGMTVGATLTLMRRPAEAQSGSESSVTEAAARNAIDAVNQVLAGDDPGLLDGIFASTYVNHTPRRSFATGRLVSPDLDGLKASLSELREAMPDGVLIIEEIIADGDSAAVRGRCQGTLDPTPGSVTASQRIDVGGIVMLSINDGLVVASWDYGAAAELAEAGTAAAPVAPTVELTATPSRGEVREVHDFQAVSLDGVGTLVITQGETEALTIEAEPHVLERIETRVEDGTLFIRPDESFETDEPILYNLTVLQLNSIEVLGAGQVEAAAFTAEELVLRVSGSGRVYLDGLNVGVLDVAAGGSAELELAGVVDQQIVVLGGASHYAASNLESRVAAVTVEAAGEATVMVSEQLEADVSGAGRISYLGDPVVSQVVSGAGTLSKEG